MNRNRFRIAAAILLGAFALVQAGPAGAFVRLARTAADGVNVVQAHWLPSELPLPSVINPANSDKSNADALGQIQAAAQSWQDIPTSYFTVNAHEFMGAPETPPDLEFDGQNSVFFDTAGTNFPTAGVIAFVRSVVDNTTGHTLDADMVFNDRDFWWSVTSPALEPAPAGQSSVDLQSVACHEYGHYFSLDHTSITGATMIPFIQNNTTQRTLELDDAAGNSTVYPEGSFGTSTGTVSGTVISGFNGSATFGAHVEAILLSSPIPANSISAISGELTLRNGMGEFTLHGLPPGDYGIRIVPLDGVHTTATDANIGGPYNGLDINFEVEYWNGANEGPNGFVDLPGDLTPVTVAAGGAVSGINFITNTHPGQVVIAQAGAFENTVTFRSTGYRAVRFDPPFDPPYTITQVDFPSFIFTGTFANFLSVRLCPMNPATGLPDLAAPLFIQAPFAGSANGTNTVPLNLTINSPGQTYFWVMEFPLDNVPGPAFPANFPFLFMDFNHHDMGFFANSYDIPLAGPAGILIDRNIITTMTCQMSSPDATPISAPSGLGANRRATQMQFSYSKPGDTRADGFPMAANSLDYVELIARSPYAYADVASSGAGTSSIKLDPAPPSVGAIIWSTQAVDKNGHRSIQSNVTITGFDEDADEPNGRLNEAKALTVPVANRAETYSPAGDEDFYSVMAKPGDVIDASATATGLDTRNDMDLVMFLYDNSGEIVAFSDDVTGLNPRIIFTVPPPSGNAMSMAPRKFTIHITDYYHSFLSETTAPRVLNPRGYVINATVTTPVNAAAAIAGGLRLDQFGFRNSGPNPANPIAKFVYVVPRGSGPVSVKVNIYDVNGRLVRSLIDRTEEPGVHGAVWDGRTDGGQTVASGRYFARMSAQGGYTETAPITILK
jgi:hypothetical protein